MSNVVITCDICQKRANGSCSQLSNDTCSDFRIIPEYDRAILASATVSHDHYLRGTARQSDLNLMNATEGSDYYKNISVDQKLYYRNKYTGEIEYGIVRRIEEHQFEFEFSGRIVKLGYSAINTRLFLSRNDVIRSQK